MVDETRNSVDYSIAPPLQHTIDVYIGSGSGFSGGAGAHASFSRAFGQEPLLGTRLGAEAGRCKGGMYNGSRSHDHLGQYFGARWLLPSSCVCSRQCRSGEGDNHSVCSRVPRDHVVGLRPRAQEAPRRSYLEEGKARLLKESLGAVLEGEESTSSLRSCWAPRGTCAVLWRRY